MHLHHKWRWTSYRVLIKALGRCGKKSFIKKKKKCPTPSILFLKFSSYQELDKPKVTLAPIRCVHLRTSGDDSRFFALLAKTATLKAEVEKKHSGKWHDDKKLRRQKTRGNNESWKTFLFFISFSLVFCLLSFLNKFCNFGSRREEDTRQNFYCAESVANIIIAGAL